VDARFGWPQCHLFPASPATFPNDPASRRELLLDVKKPPALGSENNVPQSEAKAHVTGDLYPAAGDSTAAADRLPPVALTSGPLNSRLRKDKEPPKRKIPD